MNGSSGFEYSSQPRSVAVKRSKYREAPASSEKNQNLMFDRRVVRGSTYASNKTGPETMESIKKPLVKKKNAMEITQRNERPATPPPIDGRQHMDIQTENYLEELTDKVPEMDVETQTEAFLDQLSVPIFVPQKSGVDATTQIEIGDLFDFDMEVAPILEVLVGKALEVSVMEVLEEEEIREIRRRQDAFEQQRNAELAEVQRLEAEAKRKYDEKQRRLEEEKVRLAAQAELQEKLAARSFAKHYLADLHTSAFSNLITIGHFQDPLEKEVKESFLPYLLRKACTNVDQIVFSRALCETVVTESLARKT